MSGYYDLISDLARKKSNVNAIVKGFGWKLIKANNTYKKTIFLDIIEPNFIGYTSIIMTKYTSHIQLGDHLEFRAAIIGYYNSHNSLLFGIDKISCLKITNNTGICHKLRPSHEYTIIPTQNVLYTYTKSDQALEERKELFSFQERFVSVVARIGGIDWKWLHTNQRLQKVVLLNNCYVSDACLFISHLWVEVIWNANEIQINDRIQFRAKVCRYSRGNGSMGYGLNNICNVKVISSENKIE